MKNNRLLHINQSLRFYKKSLVETYDYTYKYPSKIGF